MLLLADGKRVRVAAPLLQSSGTSESLWARGESCEAEPSAAALPAAAAAKGSMSVESTTSLACASAGTYGGMPPRELAVQKASPGPQGTTSQRQGGTLMAWGGGRRGWGHERRLAAEPHH